MATFFTICLVVGGTLFVIQFLMSVFGGHDGAHHLGGGAHGHSVAGAEGDHSFVSNMISFRAVVAALVVFGLSGLGSTASGLSDLVSLAIAFACALAAMVLVAMLTHGMTRLESDGTLSPQSAVGKTGTVYLTVPGQRAGLGKVTLSLQNRTAEMQALTPGPALAAGSKVVVQRVIGSDTLEVVADPALTPEVST